MPVHLSKNTNAFSVTFASVGKRFDTLANLPIGTVHLVEHLLARPYLEKESKGNAETVEYSQKYYSKTKSVENSLEHVNRLFQRLHQMAANGMADCEDLIAFEVERVDSEYRQNYLLNYTNEVLFDLADENTIFYGSGNGNLETLADLNPEDLQKVALAMLVTPFTVNITVSSEDDLVTAQQFLDEKVPRYKQVQLPYADLISDPFKGLQRRYVNYKLPEMCVPNEMFVFYAIGDDLSDKYGRLAKSVTDYVDNNPLSQIMFSVMYVQGDLLCITIQIPADTSRCNDFPQKFLDQLEKLRTMKYFIVNINCKGLRTTVDLDRIVKNPLQHILNDVCGSKRPTSSRTKTVDVKSMYIDISIDFPEDTPQSSINRTLCIANDFENSFLYYNVLTNFCNIARFLADSFRNGFRKTLDEDILTLPGLSAAVRAAATSSSSYFPEETIKGKLTLTKRGNYYYVKEMTDAANWPLLTAFIFCDVSERIPRLMETFIRFAYDETTSYYFDCYQSDGCVAFISNTIDPLAFRDFLIDKYSFTSECFVIKLLAPS